MLKFNRRHALIAGVLSAAAITLGACNGGGGGSTAPAEGEMSLGSADAPVTVVEYASVTCGVCAAWHESVLPEFTSRYIDTGQVRYVFREFPTAPANVAVAGFLLARCAGDDRYFQVVAAIMGNQRAVITNPRQELLNIARTAGMNEEQFDACVTDQTQADALQARVEDAIAVGVTGTPYFLVNGEPLEGAPTIENFEATLRPLIGGSAPAAPAASDAGEDAVAEAPEAPAETPATTPAEG